MTTPANETGKFGEPLSVSEDLDIIDSDDGLRLHVYMSDDFPCLAAEDCEQVDDESRDFANRTVALFNALAGIDNPAQAIERYKRIEAAAKNAHEYLGKLTFIDGDGAGANVAVRKELRAALEAQ